MDRSSANFRLEGPQINTSLSRPYYDVFPHFPSSRNFNPATEINPTHAHSNHFNSRIIHEVDGGLPDGTISTRRGPFKRKIPSVTYESSSTCKFYGAGSSSNSSNSFQLQPGKPSSDYRNHSSVSIGLRPHRSANLSIGAEDSSRNVRSRSRLDLEPMTRRSYSSTYSSHPYGLNFHLQDHHRPVEFANLNTHATACEENHVRVTPAHGRFQPSANNSLSPEMHQYHGGNTADVGGYYHGPTPRRNHVSPPQYLDSVHSHLVREGPSCYPQRGLPSQRSNLISPNLVQEPAASENGQQFLLETCPSRYSRPLSARGWHRRHSEGRPDIAIERFQSLPNSVDAPDRIRSEGSVMSDGSCFYGSRNLFDEYQDMRLDTDNMSYEELLALGERIGNVNTGLSDDAISECLMETIYPMDKNEEEPSCCICLEVYKKMDKVGKVRNCGHDYHVDCIKKWLSMKNVCPICKAPALTESSNGQ
ncbi:hypothetical protein JCGZ_23941 [Jatropha curcas]|uniref:RING-type E3 ubiquitin transferase n=2 Tax=Jatropha curcas TaxID=180498 RepID=A0A067K0G8_JATCU|nr:hypothetical protein JCGZ_23941 [Jatropha curcas]